METDHPLAQMLLTNWLRTKKEGTSTEEGRDVICIHSFLTLNIFTRNQKCFGKWKRNSSHLSTPRIHYSITSAPHFCELYQMLQLNPWWNVVLPRASFVCQAKLPYKTWMRWIYPILRLRSDELERNDKCEACLSNRIPPRSLSAHLEIPSCNANLDDWHNPGCFYQLLLL